MPKYHTNVEGMQGTGDPIVPQGAVPVEEGKEPAEKTWQHYCCHCQASNEAEKKSCCSAMKESPYHQPVVWYAGFLSSNIGFLSIP